MSLKVHYTICSPSSTKCINHALRTLVASLLLILAMQSIFSAEEEMKLPKTLWSYSFKDPIYFITEYDRYVLVTTQSSLYVFLNKSGELLWNRVIGRIKFEPLCYEHFIYLITAKDELIRFDLVDGDQLYQRSYAFFSNEYVMEYDHSPYQQRIQSENELDALSVFRDGSGISFLTKSGSLEFIGEDVDKVQEKLDSIDDYGIYPVVFESQPVVKQGVLLFEATGFVEKETIDERFYDHSYGRQLVAIDVHKGNFLWSTEKNSYIYSSIYDFNVDQLAITTTTTLFNKFKPLSSSFEEDQRIKNVFTREGLIAFTTIDGNVIFLRLSNGEKVFDLKQQYQSSSGEYNTISYADKDYFYFQNDRKSLICIDVAAIIAKNMLSDETIDLRDQPYLYSGSNEIKWTLSLADEIITNMLSKGDTLFFGTADGQLYAVNRLKGIVDWQKKINNPVIKQLEIVDEGLYVLSHLYQYKNMDESIVNTSYIGAYERKKGNIVWSHNYEKTYIPFFRTDSKSLSLFYASYSPYDDEYIVRSNMNNGFQIYNQPIGKEYFNSSSLLAPYEKWIILYSVNNNLNFYSKDTGRLLYFWHGLTYKPLIASYLYVTTGYHLMVF